MIISHKHKFIFIKAQKTAGTSLEIALSKYCGPQDIITPISGGDLARKELGYPSAQNYHIPPSKFSLWERIKILLGRKPKMFYNHISAAEIKRYVDADVWEGYYKFCFERNPWDKAVSFYYWRTRNEVTRPSVSAFFESTLGKLRNASLYMIGDRVAVDHVAKYENLEEELAFLTTRLNLPEPLKMPAFRAKGQHRVGKRHYSELLTPKEADIVAKRFSREIELMGYTF